jgi:hypothetical protein
VTDHAHDVETAFASDSRHGRILAGVLQETLESRGLLADLAQELRTGCELWGR